MGRTSYIKSQKQSEFLKNPLILVLEDFSLLVNYFPAIKLKQWVQKTGKWHPNYYWTPVPHLPVKVFFGKKDIFFTVLYIGGPKRG